MANNAKKKMNEAVIEYKGNKYKLVFNLNVIQLIQEEYGTFDKWTSLVNSQMQEVDMKALIFGFKEAINEGIDISNEDAEEKQPFFTEKQIGRMITEIGLSTASKKLEKVIIDSAGEQEKN